MSGSPVSGGHHSQFGFRRWGLFACYLALQGIVVAGLPTQRLTDSASYIGLSFTGANGRLFTVPLFYALLLADPVRICGQVVLAAISWWILASNVSSSIADRRVSVGARIVLLALGLVGPISSWNTTILSESVAISLTALVFGLWFRYTNAPTFQKLILLLVVGTLWMFSRPDNLVIGTIVVLAWTFWTVIKHREVRRVVPAVAMCGICILGLSLVGNLHTRNDVNLADIIAQRILPDPDYTHWFVDHGMPYSPAIAGDAHDYPATPLLNDPLLSPWIDQHGSSTYVEFVLTHPVSQLQGWLVDLSGEKPSLTVSPPQTSLQPNPSPSLLSPTANYGRHRDVLPQVVQDVMFEQGQIGDVLVLAVGAGALTIVARRRTGRDHRLLVPAFVLGLGIVQTALVWLTEATELDRLSMVPAVEIRIALWTVVACSLDRLLPLWLPRGTKEPLATS